jgi:hypothetical protein
MGLAILLVVEVSAFSESSDQLVKWFLWFLGGGVFLEAAWRLAWRRPSWRVVVRDESILWGRGNKHEASVALTDVVNYHIDAESGIAEHITFELKNGAQIVLPSGLMGSDGLLRIERYLVMERGFQNRRGA